MPCGVRTAGGRRQIPHLFPRPVPDDHVRRVVGVRRRRVGQQLRRRSSPARHDLHSHDGSFF